MPFMDGDEPISDGADYMTTKSTMLATASEEMGASRNSPPATMEKRLEAYHRLITRGV
jgi:hypothetical protein